jgi:uncharacterized protein YlzI (FlbEa/FlbD family)
MLRHIELTQMDGEPVRVDPELIVQIEADPDDLVSPAKILLATGEKLIVLQTMDQVVERIEALGSRSIHRPSDN